MVLSMVLNKNHEKKQKAKQVKKETKKIDVRICRDSIVIENLKTLGKRREKKAVL
jgi:hypothetical protein